MNRARLLTAAAACVAAAAGWMAFSDMGGRQPSPHAPGQPVAGVGDAVLYTCGMHPQVVQEGPGQCPICGMNLTPIDSGAADGEAGGRRAVQVSRGFLQNFAVPTTAVRRADLPVRIRTIGFLDRDEARLVSVIARYDGWIERPRVSTVGQRVSEGDVLFEIYSPDLLTAEQEYLAAIDYAKRLQRSEAHPSAISGAEALVVAAGDRLRHWDLPDRRIASLTVTGKPSRTVPSLAPVAGLVVEKLGDTLDGARVEPGTVILKIADHSTLWAKVEFYENHLRDLRPGLEADISLDAFPGQRWRGTLLFFEPAMDPRTQTLTGFVEIENADGRLRPKMYATVEMQLPGARNALVVPAQSVLRSGNSANVVIVNAGNGLFVPRSVDVGVESGGLVQVRSGLREGERVVTASQFLLDSESNLQAAVERLARGAGGGNAR